MSESRSSRSIRIEAGFQNLFSWSELWRRRELIYFFARRDIRLRFTQTRLGAMWSVLQPLLSVGVFTFLMSTLVGVPSNGKPYPLFNLAGMVLWIYFANALSRCGHGLISNSHLLGKVYFPRLLIPISALIPGLADLAVAMILVALACLWYGNAPSPSLLLAVAFAVIGTALLALAVGLWISVFNARYRDVSHLMPFFLQLWMFCTPVIYPMSLVPEKYRLAVQCNPMAGWIDLFRSAWLNLPYDLPSIVVSAAMTLMLLATGVRYFQSKEGEFADMI